MPTARSWETFESEVLPHLDRLFRLAMWLERDRLVAEDLVQDTMVQALRSLHRSTPGTNCRVWLISILQHLRTSRHRAALRHHVVDDPDDQVVETAAFVPALPECVHDKDMLAALRGIPEPYQDTILMSDVEDMTCEEIAEALSVPIGTVMSRLRRGRAALRTRLAEPVCDHSPPAGQELAPARRAR